MRVVVIGGTGTIGSAVVADLGRSHDVVVVGHTSGDYRVDLASAASIRDLYREVGRFGALVSTAGVARFGELDELSDDDFRTSLDNKLMGQVNLVRMGLEHVEDDGCFTLTSGVLASEPIRGSAAISVVNAGVEAFVRAAALEVPRGIRVNAVSPPWVSETLESMGRDPSGGLPAATVAGSYRRAVEGWASGEVLDVREHS